MGTINIISNIKKLRTAKRKKVKLLQELDEIEDNRRPISYILIRGYNNIIEWRKEDIQDFFYYLFLFSIFPIIIVFFLTLKFLK